MTLGKGDGHRKKERERRGRTRNEVREGERKNESESEVDQSIKSRGREKYGQSGIQRKLRAREGLHERKKESV